ncbi:MAG: precorrin-2 dehydrogenase/sirohydrochlorin ferrochelatase family protein [Thermodesulfobacteriota bacterium]
MEYYPVFLNLCGKNILVVGGGNVALRKTKSLLNSGAFVFLVSPEINNGFEKLKKNNNLLIRMKKFEKEDISKMFLVFSATDDNSLNKDVMRICRENGKLCNIADSGEDSDFIVPSSIKRGDLTLAVSTGGKSPALSRKLRQDLEKEFGDEYEVFLYFLGEIRNSILEKRRGDPENKNLFREMVFGNLLKSIKDKDIENIENELKEILDSRDLAQGLMDKLLQEKNDYFFDVEKFNFSATSKGN